MVGLDQNLKIHCVGLGLVSGYATRVELSFAWTFEVEFSRVGQLPLSPKPNILYIFTHLLWRVGYRSFICRVPGEGVAAEEVGELIVGESDS